MSDYLTLVFDASELAEDERLALCQRASAMSWNHAMHERDGLGRMLHDKAVALQRAEGERDRLREELIDRFTQTRCGCGHPACKRCRDDAETERVLRECHP